MKPTTPQTQARRKRRMRRRLERPHRLLQRRLRRRKRRIQERLKGRMDRPRSTPMFAASNIQYEMADRTRAIPCGGIGALHLLARNTGLIQTIDRDLRLLKVHKPYHESDHVLNIAYNIACGGECLEDLELLRNDEAYLDALGAARIPDPTTAGDFCRRFSELPILNLMEAINKVRLGVWKRQGAAFFKTAVLDADGTLAPTEGECKQGMNISYDGQWGYHPLVISLANTKEPLYLLNRSGNRPSHERADEFLDRAVDLCRRAGFQSMVLRGDTDFMQTWKLDEWDGAGDITFYFGADARKPMIHRAEALPPEAWTRLQRPPRYTVQTQPRHKPQNVKEQVVREKGFRNLVLLYEDVAQFEHRPDLCTRSYRLIVLRKRIAVEKKGVRLEELYRYFFYITNDRQSTAQQVIFQVNQRCNQENLIEQLKNGVKAMGNPVDTLYSNWAYMVMASLAWTLKAWTGLLLPAPAGRWHGRYEAQRERIVKMEFKQFVNGLMRLPCQIVRTGRRLVYRLMSWNRWTATLIRLVQALRHPLRC